MYMHTLARFCESQRCFSLLSPLNITYSFFCLPASPCCLPSACPPDAWSCCVSCGGCRVVCPLSSSPFIPIGRALEAPRRPSVCPAVCPSLVCHQAQDGVAVWANAPRICPRLCPCLLLPMCCRVFRRLFRGLSCLLPFVVWW